MQSAHLRPLTLCLAVACDSEDCRAKEICRGRADYPHELQPTQFPSFPRTTMASPAPPKLSSSFAPCHHHYRCLGGNAAGVVAVWGRRPAWVSARVVIVGVPRRRRRSVSFPHRARAAGGDVASSSSAFGADDAGGARARSAVPPGVESLEASTSGALHSGDGYVGLFVRMLGLDNDPLDREHAVITLWKYSQGGKHCVDAIMKFPGCVILIINLLKSDSNSVREAAAGLLRNLSSVSLYIESIAGNGAIEEIAGLLCLPDLTPEVKEQSLCVLWNLSTDEILRMKIATSDILHILIKYLDDEAIKVKEAAGGVLANLALSHCNHSIMVEAGVIPKLAELLKSNTEGHRVIRKEAKNVLLELSKDEYYKILIVEEGLVLVPLVGAAAYKSLRPVSHSWPSLPDGTEIERTLSPSRYGASEMLLGLNVREKSMNLEDAKMQAIVGRSQQQFLARIGAIEIADKDSPSESLASNRQTILPWMDGVARLVLILGLEDVSAITRAGHAIADASVNEHMRVAFKEAGAVRLLIQLLGHSSDAVREAAIHGLERLSVSFKVCQIIEAEWTVDPLVDILKNRNPSNNLKEKILSILARTFDPSKGTKAKLHGNLVNGQYEMDNKISFQEMGGLTATQDLVSMPTVMMRDKVLDSGFISTLVEILKMPLANLQKMAASILEYYSNCEEHVTVITAAGIESGLAAVFQTGRQDDSEHEPEPNAIEVEEIGLAIAAASRLLTKLLNFELFHRSIDSMHFTNLLRKVLRSDIPLHAKNWVAACLVKIESLVDSEVDIDCPIDVEVAIYETIPRLVEQLKTSFSRELQEAAVIELNNIISKGIAECTKAVVATGGIPLLVKLIEEGSGSAVEASLAILYNISMDFENHSAVLSAGAVPVLRRLVLSERPQWTQALHLLRTLPT